MTATELSVCLLAIDTETGMLDEENIVADVADLSSLASGLLVFDSSQVEDESALVVSHRSVQDFLMSPSAGDFKVDGASSHLHVAMVSLKYLLIPNFDTVCTSWEDLTDRFITFPFLDYAARCWSFQVAKVATTTPELLSAMMTLFMGPNFLPWLQVFKSDRNVPNYLTFHVDAKPLYWAARLGLKDLVDHILKSGVDVNESGGFFGTPLTMAAYNGDVDMVKLLLAKGADVNRPAGHYHTALQAAAFTGSDAIVELLLNSGADLNARGGFFSTPLIAAEKAGHQPIVNRLLDLDLQHPTQAPDPADSAEFLGSAILGSDAPAVRRILQTGLDVNARLPGFSNWRKEDPNSGHSHYPLILAISSSSLEVIQLIIDAGADLDVSDGYHGSALAYAAYRGSKDVVYALLQGGANPMVGRYSGSRLPRFIQELEPAQRDKVSKVLVLRSRLRCMLLYNYLSYSFNVLSTNYFASSCR
jgi:ankyrin repeat protein